MNGKPIILITMGDPAGVGPEVFLKALRNKDLYWRAIIVILADEGVLELTRRHMNIDIEWQPVSNIENLDPASDKPYLLSLGNEMDLSGFDWGTPRAEEGLSAVFYLMKATELLKEGLAHGLVTSPIYKSSLVDAGHDYPGQSELLSAITNSKYAIRMLVGDTLKVSLATGHIPISQVPKELSPELVFDTIRYTHHTLINGFDIKQPKIAVCGLNPHGGDASTEGTEEEEMLKPAISQAQAEGVDVVGPLSTGEVFVNAVRGGFTAVVAMYHDQGVTPFKLLHLDLGVTVTLGLPFVRTAPVHGPAFEIAGKGQADCRSMLGAIITAANLASREWESML